MILEEEEESSTTETSLSEDHTEDPSQLFQTATYDFTSAKVRVNQEERYVKMIFEPGESIIFQGYIQVQIVKGVFDIYGYQRFSKGVWYPAYASRREWGIERRYLGRENGNSGEGKSGTGVILVREARDCGGRLSRVWLGCWC